MPPSTLHTSRWICRGCDVAGTANLAHSAPLPLIVWQGCAAKLTGAGGGGCAFAVLDERKDAEAQRLQLVSCHPSRCFFPSHQRRFCPAAHVSTQEQQLALDFPQFRCFQLRAGGDGVQWQ